MSKWLSTSITLIAKHRNRSFWTERKNFIVWDMRRQLDRFIERTHAWMREKYSPTHVNSDIGDVKGTSVIERQSNAHSYKRGMFPNRRSLEIYCGPRKVLEKMVVRDPYTDLYLLFIWDYVSWNFWSINFHESVQCKSLQPLFKL